MVLVGVNQRLANREGASVRHINKLAITVFLAALVFAGWMLFHFERGPGGITHASPAEELLSQIPGGAPILVYIDLAAIRNSSFYQHRPNPGPLTIPDHDYADFVQATGFDFEKDLDRVMIAAWPAAAGQEKKAVAVADGRFDRQKIRDYALHGGKLEQQNGRDVFLFQSPGKPGWKSLAFLDDHRIALVDGPSIAPLLAAHDASVSDPARERAARLNGATMFMIMRIPDAPADKPAGGMPPQAAALLRSLQWVTLAAQTEQDVLRISLEGECKTASDATQMQSGLEILRMFGSSALADPKVSMSLDPRSRETLQSLLKSADVSTSGERVRIRLEAGPAILDWPSAHAAPTK